MLAAVPSIVAYVPQSVVSAPASTRATVTMETVEDLKTLSTKLNPALGYWNPLGLGEDGEFWGVPAGATVNFLRHSEIKHGRVAMAAFIGYCVQSNFCFPWALTGGSFGGETIMYSTIQAAGSPAAQWDALPTLAKLQIIGAVGFLEFLGESQYCLEKSGATHYMRGGKPGYYPSLKALDGVLPHPVPLDLWDPFGFTKKMTPEKKEKALLAEINNGRLAMLGIFGLISASKGLIVPGLDSLGLTPYDGEVMAPFTAADNLPLVQQMLSYNFLMQ